jgi:FMN phosphatase YigB (HAD superfamily)
VSRVDANDLKTIVFDVDGTLYRQGGLRRAMLFKLLRELLVRPLAGLATLRALRAYRHAQEALRDADSGESIAAAQLRIAVERTGLAEERVAAIVARWMDREPLPLLGRFVAPEVKTFLAAARGRGLRLGVLSDYPAAGKLDALGLGGLFDVVVSAQDAEVNRFKPHPTGLLEVLRRLDVAPAQALYVGDRPDVDGGVARAAGVRCIIVGHRGPARPSEGWTPVSGYAELHATLFASSNQR